VTTITDVSGSSPLIAPVASMPSMRGMAMSIRTTSGRCSRASSTAARPSPARPTTTIRSSVERIASSASAKSRWSSTIRTLTGRDAIHGYLMPRMDEAAAREKIHDLLVLGDNRLKQGVATEKIRANYEQALELAREHGLEGAIGPLVEVRLADLERLGGGSPPPGQPAA